MAKRKWWHVSTKEGGGSSRGPKPGFNLPENDQTITRRDLAALTEAGQVEPVDMARATEAARDWKGPEPSEESVERLRQLTAPGPTEEDFQKREQDPKVRARREAAAAEAARREGRSGDRG